MLPTLLIPLILCLAPQEPAPVPPAAITDSVNRGVEWLLHAQRRDGSWGEYDMAPGGHRDPRNDLTAFVTYTLLKCKVGLDHPAIQRALVNLEQGDPHQTYSIAVQLMLLSETKDERYKKRIEQLTDLLLEFRSASHEVWGYPNHPSLESDLSNTQYAALGLRAAKEAGVSVPDKVWSEMIARVLEHLEEPRKVDDPEAKGKDSKRTEAGFAYLIPNLKKPSKGYNVPNASMTAAGLALISIAKESLGGKFPRNLAGPARRATQHAWAYLDDGHIDTVIGLPANLFYSTGIPVCIIVLKKCKKPDDVLFINACEHYAKDKRQNRLRIGEDGEPNDIEKIITTYINRPEEEERYCRRVGMDEIIENDYNLNITRYVSTAKPEPIIDLGMTHKAIVSAEQDVRDMTAKHNEYLMELGLPLLPNGIDKTSPSS